MKLQIFKLVALVALFMGGLSCTNDLDDPQSGDPQSDNPKTYPFKWDGSKQQEEFRPINQGTESSSFSIDSIFISFAVPYLVGTVVFERLPESGYGGPNSFSPHFWVVTLIMAKGTDVTKLAPVITLAPGATITLIDTGNEQVPAKQVNYTGIAEVGAYNFRHQVDFTVIAPDGSTVKYKFLAVAIGDLLPCPDCP